MAKVLLLQQSTRKQLKEMKSIINPARYSTLKEKILGAKRVSTLQNVQAKLSKIHSDNAEFVSFKQELLGSLQQYGSGQMDKQKYGRTRANINRSKTLKNLHKHYDAIVPPQTIYLSGKASVRKENGKTYDDAEFNTVLTYSPRLKPQELKKAIDASIQTHFDTPRKGVYGVVLNHNASIHHQPPNFNPSTDMPMKLPKPLKLKLMEQVGEVSYSRNENCVINYLHNELQKVYIKHDIKKLEHRIAKLGYNPEQGMTLEMFQKVMQKYPYVAYTVLSPTFSLMAEYSARNEADHQSLRLTFYVNNGHLYPINSPNMQHQIELHKETLRPYMKNEVQQFVLPSDYCYMDEADVCQDFTQHQQPMNIIINKQTKMEELLKVTVQLTGHAPEYIRVDEKN